MRTDLFAELRAALDAEEKAARAAARVCGCHPEVPSWSFGDVETDGRIVVDNDPHLNTKRKMGRRWNGSYEGLFTARHIVRHDPKFVLADIAAKRKLIARGGPFCTSGCDNPDSPPMNPDTDWTTSLEHHLDCGAYEAARVIAEAYGVTPEGPTT